VACRGGAWRGVAWALRGVARRAWAGGPQSGPLARVAIAAGGYCAVG